MYCYEFPFFEDFARFQPGMPVSIDSKGNAWPGAGTTIYRNVAEEPITYSMNNVKLRQLNHFMTLAVFDGGVAAFRGTFDNFEVQMGKTDLPTVDGQIRRVSEVVAMNRDTFIIVGSNQLLPLTVLVTRPDSGPVTVSFQFGIPTPLNEVDDNKFPHIDVLTNTTVAMIYERNMNLYTRKAELKGTGTNAQVSLGSEVRVGNSYEFHKVAGMDANHYIIAATGRLFNSSFYYPAVTAVLCTIKGDTIEIGEWKYLAWAMSHNYMDMDNFDFQNAIMVFTDAAEHSIIAVMVHFDREENDISFGSSRTIQNGGAVFFPEKIDMRILSPTTFAVFYEDQVIHKLCLVLCSVSSSRDISVASPTYVVSLTSGAFSYDLCESGMGDFVILENRVTDQNRVFMHYGVVLPRPFGIAQKTKNGKLTIQFAGMFKVPTKQRFTPGRAIYTNSKGELLEGRPFGMANRESGLFYEHGPDRSLLSQNNLVGVAVTKNKIYMKFL